MATQPVELAPKEYPAALDLLKKIDFLIGVDEAELKSILFNLQKQSFKGNSTVLFQGEIANRLFIIQKGDVTISTKNKGNKLILAELGAPMYFGEISLLTPTAATATAKAGDDGADVIIITHDAMADLQKAIPDIQERIKKVIDDRVASKKKAKQDDDDGE